MFKTETPYLRSSSSFSEEYVFLIYSIRNKYKLIESIYEHFEENCKLAETRYNYRTIKWTLRIGFLTLITTVIFANDFEIINNLWKVLSEFSNLL